MMQRSFGLTFSGLVLVVLEGFRVFLLDLGEYKDES
jgi:hypothetical protein